MTPRSTPERKRPTCPHCWSLRINRSFGGCLHPHGARCRYFGHRPPAVRSVWISGIREDLPVPGSDSEISRPDAGLFRFAVAGVFGGAGLPRLRSQGCVGGRDQVTSLADPAGRRVSTEGSAMAVVSGCTRREAPPRRWRGGMGRLAIVVVCAVTALTLVPEASARPVRSAAGAAEASVPNSVDFIDTFNNNKLTGWSRVDQAGTIGSSLWAASNGVVDRGGESTAARRRAPPSASRARCS